MSIDIHAHVVPVELLRLVGTNRGSEFPSVKIQWNNNVAQVSFDGSKWTRPITENLTQMEQRLTWMDIHGIDQQVISGWLDIFGYGLPAKEGAAWAREFNRCLLELHAKYRRLIPLCTVPLQDPHLAATVLSEAMEAGFPGVMIGTQPDGCGGVLDDARLDEFWATASERNAVVYIHPMIPCGDQRVQDIGRLNALGRISDATVAVGRLLLSGHLIRYPGLHCIVSHGGAALPYIVGRLGRAAEINHDWSDPYASLRRLYTDSIVFDSRALEFLVNVIGADRVMLGTDAPFPIGDSHPSWVVERTRLTTHEKQMILSLTAQGLFNQSN